MIVELKRPTVKIDDSAANQISSYTFAIEGDERFKDPNTNWIFWAVSNDISDSVRRQSNQRFRPEGLYHDGENVQIWIKTWGQLIDDCRARLHFFQEKLQYQADHDSAIEYLRNLHNKYLPKLIKSSDIK